MGKKEQELNLNFKENKLLKILIVWLVNIISIKIQMSLNICEANIKIHVSFFFFFEKLEK